MYMLTSLLSFIKLMATADYANTDEYVHIYDIFLLHWSIFP